jgi:hypothetical protein
LWVNKSKRPWKTTLWRDSGSQVIGEHDGAKAGPTLGHWLPALYPTVTDVFLAGMDLGTDSKTTNNNVYENTKNYAPSYNPKAHLVYTSDDETAWARVFMLHAQITWHWLKPAWRKVPSSWPTTVVIHESKESLDSVLREHSVPA